MALDYPQLRADLAGQLARLPARAPVRLGKSTSNLFRPRSADATARLDVRDFHGVLSVDAADRRADVLGMTTYSELVDATLPHGLLPLVVPELKTITLGGAVSGLGIESTSFRHGLVHESVTEFDVLTGDARVLTVRPDGEHAELFTGFPNSYGTLGYALRLRIELMPVRPYVHLTHERHPTVEAAAARLAELAADPAVDFLDGVHFAPAETYLTVGRFTDTAPAVSDYTGAAIYYQSLRQRREDHLRVRDYIWRWDTDWFWCSAAFGAQHPAVRRVWPRRWRRSDVYWRLVALEDRWGVKRAYDRARGRPERERVIQDVQVPVERLAEFLAEFRREVGLTPVWLCPVRVRDPARRSPLYPLDPASLYVNIGFWGTVPLAAGQPPTEHNRRVERLVARLDGHKSLYSSAYYDRDEFDARYGGATYRALKARYDPNGRLPELYDKCVKGR